ncbi:MAG: septum formation initiator family protein [bacterium]
MLEFQEKRKIRKMMYSKPALIVLFIAIVFLLKEVYDIYQKQQISRQNYDRVATSVESLKSREKMLTSELDRLSTNQGVEAEIREKFNVVKPGEEIIMVINSSSSEADQTAGNSEQNWWQKFIGWFAK